MQMLQRQCLKNVLLMFMIFSYVIIGFQPTNTQAKMTVSNENLEETITDIIQWKKKSMGLNENSYLLNNKFLKNAGDTVGDWYPIGIGRVGYKDDYEAYLAVISNVVEQRYKTKDQLSDSKSTEWHRISLAVLAMGGDPTTIGIDTDGKTINLIEDGTYNRGNVASLGAQGINGWIWGLITLDSRRYIIPANAYYSRNTIIQEILQLQLEDGGFSFYHDVTDSDMTAMALQALAPYYNSEEVYSYKQKATNKTVQKSVRQVVDEALATLSSLQTNNGDFKSGGQANAESTAQVLVALTALGINPLEDKRFVKEGKHLIDGLMQYKMDDGGFIHSKMYNAENPTSLPDQSNSMASEQVLYALTAFYRYQNNYRSLYDFREEMDATLKEKIANLNRDIMQLQESVNHKEIEDLFSQYLSIPVTERSYVYSYKKLAQFMQNFAIENSSEYLAQNMNEFSSGNGTITALFGNDLIVSGPFTEQDKLKVEELPNALTTEYYVDVIKLLKKLENAKNMEDYKELVPILKTKKQQIESIEAEITALNEEILEHLYPFSQLTLADRAKVDEIVERFNHLSAYDQQKILSVDDVRKSKVQIDNLYRARILKIVVAIIVVVILTIVVRRIRKRRKNQLEENRYLEE